MRWLCSAKTTFGRTCPSDWRPTTSRRAVGRSSRSGTCRCTPPTARRSWPPFKSPVPEAGPYEPPTLPISMMEAPASRRAWAVVNVAENNSLQALVGDVAASHPKQSGWRTMASDQLNEIGILADQHHVCSSTSPAEYLGVFGVTQAKVTHRKGLHTTRCCQPGGKPWRKLRINPEDHATRRSRSVRRAAKCRHARMSSASRSGKSASRVAWSTPCASISSTSLTRMRMPLIQGLPPHCSGFHVIRESRCSDIGLLSAGLCRKGVVAFYAPSARRQASGLALPTASPARKPPASSPDAQVRQQSPHL